MGARPLTAQQADARAVQEAHAVTLFVCGPEGVRGNMTEAYLQARYCPRANRKTAAKSAAQFFDRPHIRLAVAALAAKMKARLLATNEDLLETLACIIHADPADAFDPATGEQLPIHKMPKNFRRAISGWDSKTGRVQLHSKIAATQTHGEWSGMYDKMLDKHIAALSEQARVERAAALLAQALERRLPLPPATAQTQTVDVEVDP